MNSARSVIKLYSNIALINNVAIRNYAFKSDLKIKWVKPAKIPSYKPAKSGDLNSMPDFDENLIAPDFKHCKELEDADEIVRRLFTLKFQPHKAVVNTYINQVKDKVRRHSMDVGSIEARIARWTGVIHALQDIMEKYPRNLRMKVKLTELIDKRKKHLKYLRKWDYKKFEWLIEALNIVYKPYPAYDRVTRKGSLRKLTQKYCDDIVESRLNAYRLNLEQEQPAFLQEKIALLEFLQKEQEECGVEITIKQEDIDKVKEQLNELQKKNSLREKDD